MIQISLNALITAPEKESLKKILKAADNQELEEKIKKVILSSLREYLNMFLGKNVFT